MEIRGVTFLAVDSERKSWRDLVDVLHSIGSYVEGLTWRLERLDCAGDPDGAERLHQLCDADARLRTAALREAAAGAQVIDGDFIGYQEEESNVQVVIRAIDSTWWDVYASDEVLERVSTSFPDAEQIPVE